MKNGNLLMALLSAFFINTFNAAEGQVVPALSHIVVVIGENTNSTSVYGNASAPYINALAAAGAAFTDSHGVSHPSQPNYLQFYSGSNQGITNDNLIAAKFTSANLGAELIAAGKTFTTYSDGLPSVGYDGATSGLYVRKHNPAANWMGSGTNQIPTTTNQPFTSFPANFANLPAVSLVVPDLCHDGHDVCAPISNRVLQYDTWIQQNLDSYKQWCINNNSLLIVTYDEDNFTVPNQIATIIYGAHVVAGSYAQTINHYNVLRTIEDANGLATHAGAAAAATPINYIWDGIVPIGLIDFSGTKSSSAAKLYWHTTPGINFTDFEIERSTNGVNFIPIANVQAAPSVNSYNFSDIHPFAGVDFYKLKLYEPTGRSVYSKIVKLDFSNKFGATVFPDLTNRYLNVNATSSVNFVSLFSMNGTLVHKWTGMPADFPLDISGVPAGVYILKLVSEKESMSLKIIIN